MHISHQNGELGEEELLQQEDQFFEELKRKRARGVVAGKSITFHHERMRQAAVDESVKNDSQVSNFK